MVSKVFRNKNVIDSNLKVKFKYLKVFLKLKLNETLKFIKFKIIKKL